MTAALKIKNPPTETALTFKSIIGIPNRERTRRTVLVTGGTDGIGTAICKKMADSGHFVATTYCDSEKALAWQKRMEKEGYLFFLYKWDAADGEDTKNLIRDITRDLGPIQILVNHDAQRRDIDTICHITQVVMDSMHATGFGRVINISSMNRRKSRWGQTHYSTAKAGIHGLTKTLAQEAAKKGITVNTISPGYIATDLIKAAPKSVRDTITAQIPVGRLGKPEDIAYVVSFLTSAHAGFITGANITANGGHSME